MSVITPVLIGTAVYVARDTERKTLDATARAGAGGPGKFVQLHDGITHYDLSGPDSGRPIVFLSGATVPFYIWDPTRDALAALGEFVMALAAPTMAKGQLDDFLHPERYPDWVERYEVQMQYKVWRLARSRSRMHRCA